MKIRARGLAPTAAANGRSTQRKGSRRRRGFSLMELLVTGAILAMIFMVASVEAMKVFQKQRLVVAAQSIEQFANRAFIEMQRRGRSVFLYLDARNATDGTTSLLLVEDTDQDGTPDVGTGDVTIDTYVIQTSSATTERDISLSAANNLQVESVNWFSDVTAATTARWLRVDSVGRTSNQTATNTQITGVATLSIVHSRMLGGSPTLTPLINYQLRISPVWNAKYLRPIL